MFIFRFVLGFALLFCTVAQLSPLCSRCKCQNSVIRCDNIDDKSVFDNSTWFDSDNQPFEIVKLAVHNSNWMTIVDFFPVFPLKELDLSHNNIRVIPEGIFHNLQNMTVLDLSHNSLNYLKPEAFKGIYHPERYMNLASLRVLRLDHNELAQIDPDLFEHVEDLEELYINNNPLKVIDVHASVAFASLLKLRVLNLSGTRIAQLPDGFLHTHRNLETLDLSDNPIQVVPTTLQYADNLKNLYLNNTGFTSLNETNCFPVMKSLESLHLCHLETLRNISKHALSGLRNLERLYLCHNAQLSNIDKQALSERDGVDGPVIYPPITELYLQHNQLVNVASDVIASWDRLVHLDVRGNPWACQCQTAWLVTVLMPIYARITTEATASEVLCGSPIEMENQKLYDLYKKNYHVRCLDIYGAHPENDAMMLVGVLAGVLICLPLLLFILYSYQRNWFGLFSSSPAAYSRQFYARNASINEDNDF